MRANDVASQRVRASRVPDLCAIPCFKERLVARLRGEMPSDEKLEEAQILFGALGDRVRLKILFALRNNEELCVCDVAHVIGMSISAASHHLRKLRDLKILKYRNDGRMAYYSLRSRLAAKLLRQGLERSEG